MFNFISKNIKHHLMLQPAERFVGAFKLLNALLWRYPVRLDFDPVSGCTLVDDGAERFWFCRNTRFRRYTDGVNSFLTKLADQYMVDTIEMQSGDWVVDCGANVGEVSSWLLKKRPDLNILAIEPENLEANCADMNIFGGQARTIRKVLWKEDTLLKFFSCGETADSSVFEIEQYQRVTEVEAIRLDTLLAEFNPPRVRLLKLEAEGAEPEILEGAQQWLSRIDYIAADLGPERGLKQEQTATPVINYLLARGFDLVDMRFDRVVCLFKNREAA